MQVEYRSREYRGSDTWLDPKIGDAGLCAPGEGGVRVAVQGQKPQRESGGRGQVQRILGQKGTKMGTPRGSGGGVQAGSLG